MIEPVPKAIPAASPSAHARSVGAIHAEAPTIYIFESVLGGMVDYFTKDRYRELAGFLIGGLHTDRRPYIEVRGFLPAVDARSRPASVTLTHETWAALTRRVDAEYPGELILGWAHSHPSLGVFLSSYDLFIQRHFFSQPWQIALVIDPCRKQLGFFQWQREHVAGCGFVCVRIGL